MVYTVFGAAFPHSFPGPIPDHTSLPCGNNVPPDRVESNNTVDPMPGLTYMAAWERPKPSRSGGLWRGGFTSGRGMKGGAPAERREALSSHEEIKGR